MNFFHFSRIELRIKRVWRRGRERSLKKLLETYTQRNPSPSGTDFSSFLSGIAHPTDDNDDDLLTLTAVVWLKDISSRAE